MQLFYTPHISGTQYTLAEEESKHCIRVLRKKKGDVLDLTDGIGNFYKAEIIDDKPKACKLLLLDSNKQEKLKYTLHMAIAPTKSMDRFEWFLEKATEIGISTITPLLCEHSERKVVKPERLEKIVVSAMKQSVKAYKPEIMELTSFSDFIGLQLPERKFIAHCEEGNKLALKEHCTGEQEITILIGPEGDFSGSEIESAIKNGFQAVSLGNSRLRTETAGVVACHTVSLMNA